MTNQAAQTMPVIDDFNGDNAKLIESARALISLSDSGSLAHHGIGGHARAILSAFIVRTEAAALSQTAGVAEGWKLVPVEPTRVMVGAGWASCERMGDTYVVRDLTAAYRAMLAAAPAASGVHPDALEDGSLSKSTAKRVDALRMAQGECDLDARARSMFEAQADPIAASWDRQWGPTKEYWRKVARGNLYATTHQPSADAVREYVTELRAQADQKMGVAGACAHDGDRARYKSAAQLLRRVADELESLLSGGSHA